MTTFARRFRVGVGLALAIASLLLLFGLPGSAVSAADTPTATPTPLVTPEAGPSGYGLKSWTSVDSEAALQEAQALWDRAKTDFPGNEGYIDYGPYLNTLERESLARFPNSVDSMETGWRLAYYQALGYGQIDQTYFATDQFVTSLQAALNSNKVTVDSLATWLPKHNFRVKSATKATDLFGDGTEAIALQVSVEEPYDVQSSQEAIFAVHHNATGFFVLPLPNHDHWSVFADTDRGPKETVTIGDYNGNGLSEIMIVTRAEGHAACYSGLEIYEMHNAPGGGGFENIVKDVPPLFSYSFNCSDVWSFIASPGQVAKDLVKTEVMEPTIAYCPQQIISTQYQWTGARYQRVHRQLKSLGNDVGLTCAVAWTSLDDGSNAEALSILERALSNGKLAAPEFGPASSDYFRFKLGVLYAFRGQAAEARATLLAVRDHPDLVSYSMAPAMAKIFLEHYKDTEDGFGACWAVVKFGDEELKKLFHGPDQGLADSEVVMQQWGFVDPYWNPILYQGVDASSLCNTDASFQSSIRDLQPATESQMIELLQQHHIPVNTVKKVDLNSDGFSDWVIVAKTESYRNLNVWFAITHGTQLTVAPTEFYPHGESFYASVQQCQLNLPDPVNVLTIGNEQFVFQLKPDRAVYWVEDLENAYIPYSAFTLPGEFQGGVRAAETCGLSKQYVWNTRLQQFAYYPRLSQPAIVDFLKLKSDVFKGASAEDKAALIQAGQALHAVLNNPRAMRGTYNLQPQLHYLEGLAYELAGNTRDAANVYWQLWHAYPDSPYALIVQKKLVRVGP